MATKASLPMVLGVAMVAAVGTSPVGQPADGTPLVIEPSGCNAVLSDHTCERPVEGSLRLWVDAPGPVVVRMAGTNLAATAVPIGSGTRLRIVTPSSGEVEIVANGRRGVLRLTEPFEPPWAAQAAAARARGDHDAARRFAEPWLSDPDAAVRARAAGTVARVNLATGNLDEALGLLRIASSDALNAGRISEAVDDGLALSFALSQRAGRWADAGAELDRLEPIVSRYPDGRARLPYYRALVASALGDARSAMQKLRLARERAERLGLSRLVWNIRNEWALSLERSGNRAGALAELQALALSEDGAITACDRATVLFNLGYGMLARAQEKPGPCAGPAPPQDPAQWLRASLELSEARCPDAYRTAMGHVLLGEVALEAGRIEQAELELSHVETHGSTSALRRDALDLEARIFLARGDANGALARYERLVALARATGRVDDERRALEGVGQALERLGRLEAAIDAFAAAEDLLVAASVLAPIGEAGTYQGARETASRARVELQLALGRVSDALSIGRAARARLLASVASVERVAELPPEARARWVDAVERYRAEKRMVDAAAAADWELATSELLRARTQRADNLRRLRAALEDAIVAMPRSSSPLEPFGATDDVAVFAMTLREGAVVFVGTRDSVRAARLDLGTIRVHKELERSIVRAASPEVGRARSVRVVTSADLSCADVHAAPLASGVPLGLAARVTYGLDLGRSIATTSRPPRALVVADTQNDLPLARDEGELVASRLASIMGIVHLTGSRASGSAVHDALSSASVFHYAGHADEVDGELVLPLASSGRLTTSDILALPMSPERVVLSACQAGRVRPNGLAIGMGLVQAFLQKGASEVLAPTRPVRDELALALARAAVRTEPSFDFSRALGELATTERDADWAAYRVWRR